MGLCNELEHLVQGYKGIKERNTFYFILKSKALANKKVTHARLVCFMWPQKKESYQAHLTAEENLIDYPGMTSTPTVGVVTIKTHRNSITSLPNAK